MKDNRGSLTAAMVLGITGGAIGVVVALFAIVVGSVSSAFDVEDGGLVAWLGFAAVFVAVLGIVGGALARSRPRQSAVVQLVAGVGGFVAVSAFWLLSGPLLLAGALLAWLGSRASRQAPSEPLPQPPGSWGHAPSQVPPAPRR